MRSFAPTIGCSTMMRARLSRSSTASSERLDGDAGGEARLAVDHGHLAERVARGDRGDELLGVPPVPLSHLDAALDQHHHEIAAVAFADHLHAGLGAVDRHEVREQPHLRGREVLQQGAARDERADLLAEAHRVAEALEVR